MTYYTTNGQTKEQFGRRIHLILPGLILFLAAVVAGPCAAQEPSDTVHLAFVGDVMIGRWIGELINKNGLGYAFQKVQPFLKEADFAFGNLESPLTTTPYLRKGYNLVADPAHIDNLTLASFDIMSLANNHITDHGPAGLAEVIQTLDEAGIAHVGAGSTITEAHQSWIGEIDSIKVAYLACDSTWGSVAATEDKPGSVHPDEWLLAAIAQARQEADLVVVSVHWGQEYEQLPNKQQQGYARALVRAGADIVAGHHPHVVQPLEWLPGSDGERLALVAYSLGNFIFDQEFSEETSESAILSCDVDAEGIRHAYLIPVHIRRGQVQPVTMRQGEHVLSHLFPQDKRIPPFKVFSARQLSSDEGHPELVEGTDFVVGWWLTKTDPSLKTPRIEDVDGDRKPETLTLSAGRACVSRADGSTLWCTPSQWQVWAGVLDDVDGDNLAEIVTLGQQNEEVAPAAGGFVQVWQWLGGEFGFGWRSLPGDYRGLWTVDVNDDGAQDIGVYEGG